MKVYLSGGFKTGWQEEVTAEILRLRPDAEIADPRENKMHDPSHYTKWNVAQIVDCDMIFAFMEHDNPGIANVAFEIGFGFALGKKVVLINQKGQRWAEMMHQASDVFDDVAGALAALRMMDVMRK